MRRHLILVALLGGLSFADVTAAQERSDLAERAGRLPALLIAAKKNDAEIIDTLFLATLIRFPKDHEKDNVLNLFKRTADRRDAIEQFLWALLNTREFLALHGMTALTPEQARQFSDRVAKALRKK
jgi:hypothetical protein